MSETDSAGGQAGRGRKPRRSGAGSPSGSRSGPGPETAAFSPELLTKARELFAHESMRTLAETPEGRNLLGLGDANIRRADPSPETQLDYEERTVRLRIEEKDADADRRIKQVTHLIIASVIAMTFLASLAATFLPNTSNDVRQFGMSVLSAIVSGGVFYFTGKATPTSS